MRGAVETPRRRSGRIRFSRSYLLEPSIVRRISNAHLVMHSWPPGSNRQAIDPARWLRCESDQFQVNLSSSRGELKAEQLLQNQFTQPPSLHYIGGCKRSGLVGCIPTDGRESCWPTSSLSHR